MNIRRFATTTALAAALALPMTGFAVAQETAPAQPAPETSTPDASQPAQNFDDDTLRSFAVAFLEVDKINKEYAPRMQEASTPEEQQKVQEEASQEMVTAVEGAEGISVQEYTSIMQAAQVNPDLAKKLTQYIGEASGGAPAE